MGTKTGHGRAERFIGLTFEVIQFKDGVSELRLRYESVAEHFGYFWQGGIWETAEEFVVFSVKDSKNGCFEGLAS